MSDRENLIEKANRLTKENINSVIDAQELLLDSPDYYLNNLLMFNGTRNDILELLSIYGDELKELLVNNFDIRKNIMYQDKTHRNDLDIENEVDLGNVINSIYEGKDLEGFEGRAKIAMVCQLMTLVNIYGMDTLRNNSGLVKKEIEYGIFYDREVGKEKNFEEILRIGDKYGKNCLNYMLNLEELQKRIDSLFDVASDAILPELSGLYGTVELYVAAKNDPNSTLEVDIDSLKKLYENYEKINKLTIKNLMSNELPPVISEPTNQLLMVHFIQDIDGYMTDKSINTFFDKEVLLAIEQAISDKYGREYDEEKDGKERDEMLAQYQETRENPFDLQKRIPLRYSYTDRHYRKVITSPTTTLSVTISTPEDLKAHLDRKIAIGFLTEDVPLEAIIATNKNFNPEKDRPDFLKDSHSIADIMANDKENVKSNETLVDWTKVKPSYIMVVKDQEVIDPQVLARAKELQEKNNLPIVVYDQYSIKMNHNKNK